MGINEKKCFFCDLSKQTSRLCFENKYFFGFYDEKPINKGHVLIIPKRHIGFFEFDQTEEKYFYESIVQVKKIVEKKYQPDSYNLCINDGELAGRTISHLSIHLVPRYRGDTTNPIASGVRGILGMYSSPIKPEKLYLYENEFLSEEDLKKLRYTKTPDKKFFLGLKALIRNSEGKILCLKPKEDRNFTGSLDLPGGRCEHRDKEEIHAVQREVFEEIGINITNIMFFDSFIFWDVSFNADPNPIGLTLRLYLADLPIAAVPKLKKEEHSSTIRWLEPSEVADSLTQYPMSIRDKIRSL